MISGATAQRRNGTNLLRQGFGGQRAQRRKELIYNLLK